MRLRRGNLCAKPMEDSPVLFSLRLWALATLCCLTPFSLAAQSWSMVDMKGTPGAAAFICPQDDAETGNFFCLHVGCQDMAPLNFEISHAGRDTREHLPVEVIVDGKPAGTLTFTAYPAEGVLRLRAPFDTRFHRELIARLRKGNKATLRLDFGTDVREVAVPLRGSSRTLGAVLEVCPLPAIPLDDPAAVVLEEIAYECRALGGTVAVEPGFERTEDLDGDGAEDVVIDYAAGVCSKMASLYCGSGGCTVGFFLSRGETYKRLYSGVIRGYTPMPGARLALDLHGTACGLYGFEACRKVFDISSGELVLLETLAGEAALAAMEADAAGDEVSTSAAPVGEEAPAPVEADAPIYPETGEAVVDEAPEPALEQTPAPAPVAVPEEAPAPEPATQPVEEESDLPAPTPTPAATPEAPKSDLEWLGDGGAVQVQPAPAHGNNE